MLAMIARAPRDAGRITFTQCLAVLGEGSTGCRRQVRDHEIDDHMSAMRASRRARRCNKTDVVTELQGHACDHRAEVRYVANWHRPHRFGINLCLTQIRWTAGGVGAPNVRIGLFCDLCLCRRLFQHFYAGELGLLSGPRFCGAFSWIRATRGSTAGWVPGPL
jgi:hypothetical protein